MAGRVKLEVNSGAAKGKEFTFEEHDTLLVGRMDDCHIQLPASDHTISRRHCILEVNPPDVRVRDLGSKNGTFVNGKEIGRRDPDEGPEEGAKRAYPQIDLCDGDEIKAGDTILRVSVDMPTRHIEQIFCKQCGKNVIDEVGQVREGDYMCNACREGFQDDPHAVVADLIEQAKQARRMLQKERQPENDVLLNEYEQIRLLGKGGMGAVYLVKHRDTGHFAALKVMLSQVAVDEDARQRFLLEARVNAELKHPNIVEFLGQGSKGSAFYFLLEFCEGGSVADLMAKRGGRLSVVEAAPLMLQVLEGLAFAHEQKFIHRDLKPHNLLLTGKDGLWTAKLADMGLAKSFERSGFSGHTTTGTFAGSYPFMPREQVANFKRVQPVSDVWAIGATFYNMLTGQFPRNFPKGEDPLEVILDDVIVPIQERNKDISPGIQQVINRAIANQLTDRYQNAGEMLADLKRVL